MWPLPSSIADNLPVATRLEFYPNREAGGEDEQKKDVAKDVQFEHGYRLGFVDSNKVRRGVTALLSSGGRSLEGRSFHLDGSGWRRSLLVLVFVLSLSITCTTTCPSSCTSIRSSWRRGTSTTTGWCGLRLCLRV